jgi:hypothetical protein
MYHGRTATQTGDLLTARSYLEESFEVFAELNDRVELARVLEALAGLAGASGQQRQAAYLFGAAEGIRVRHDQPHFPHEGSDYADAVAAARSGANDAAWTAAWAEGRALPMTEAIVSAREATRDA